MSFIHPAVALEEVMDFQNGRSFKKSEWTQIGLPIIRIQNLNDSTKAFNHFAGEYDSRIEVNPGDLLFSWSGTVGSSFGPHIWEGPRAVLNQHIFRVTLNDSIDPRYAFYALRQITKDIEQQVSGAVGLVHITKSKLNQFTIPLPPLAEQKRIVAILDEAFEAIERLRELNDSAVSLAKQLLVSAIDYSLDSAGGIPTPLSELLTSQPRNGWSPPKQYQTGDGVPVMTLSAVTGFQYRSDKYTMSSAPTKPDAHYWLKKDDLLLTRSNTKDLVGHVAVCDGTPPAAICPDLIMKMKADESKALTRYVYYCLRSSRTREYFMTAASGTSGTMQKINKGVVQGTIIPLNPIDVQQQIVSFLDDVAEQSQNLIAQRLAKSRAINSLQQQILSHAFCGRLKCEDTTGVTCLAEAIA